MTMYEIEHQLIQKQWWTGYANQTGNSAGISFHVITTDGTRFDEEMEVTGKDTIASVVEEIKNRMLNNLNNKQ